MTDNKYENLPAALGEALKRTDVLAGQEQLDLYYELYDPATGGFYYSISSRDTKEMTPFAEGTSFSLEALRYGGMTLPDWYKEKVSKWILNHQDEGDGFFYEDLWGKITSGPRLNRDLAYSTGILNLCGVKPKYPLPEERIKNNEISSTLPEYLESKEKMKEYLDSLDWSTASIWSTGQKLTTAKGLMKAAGLFEYVHDYIVDRQNKETGLWGDDLTWMNTNGAMKLSGFFQDEEHPFPLVETMINSVKWIFKNQTPPSSATHIWNPFVLLNAALNSNAKEADKYRAMLLDAGADIVNCAVDCALPMKRDDGGFASSAGGAIKRQQGYLFGLGLKTESDLDGTLIAGPRLRNFIHSVFGVPASKDYYAHKNDEFWEKCRNKAPIVKKFEKPDEPWAPVRK